MKRADSPSYVVVKHQCMLAQSPLGKKEIGHFLCAASKNADLQGRITIHYVRCVFHLPDANIQDNSVLQLSRRQKLKSQDACKTALY